MAARTSASPLAWSIDRMTEVSCSDEARRLARISSSARLERRWEVAIDFWLVDRANFAFV